MKRIINGVRMLKDIESKKVSLFEKMIYLFVVIGPGLPFLNIKPDEDLIKVDAYLDIFIFVLSAGLFYVLSKDSEGQEKAIERYICLAVPAIVTCYIFLIPLSILLEAAFRRQITKESFEVMFDYFLTFYMPLYAPISLYIWKSSKRKIN